MYDSDHGSEETREDIERERREREMEWEMEKRSKVVRKIMETMDCFDYLESESLKQKLNPKEYLIRYELLLNKMTDMVIYRLKELHLEEEKFLGKIN